MWKLFLNNLSEVWPLIKPYIKSSDIIITAVTLWLDFTNLLLLVVLVWDLLRGIFSSTQAVMAGIFLVLAVVVKLLSAYIRIRVEYITAQAIENM